MWSIIKYESYTYQVPDKSLFDQCEDIDDWFIKRNINVIREKELNGKNA
jgi:hypothetical protein